MEISVDATNIVNEIKKKFSDHRSGVIYTFGNGGSASIADHMACDWMKGTYTNKPGCKSLRVISLSSNGALLSAIANDMGYEETGSRQIQWLADAWDIIVLISSSGTSKNIVKAAEEARRKGCILIGFTGFTGGSLKQWADVSVHCDSDDYGVIEDYHSNVLHEVARQLRQI